jgi:predicted metalloendopeptidase
MRRFLTALGVTLTAAALGAQQPAARQSGIATADIDPAVRAQDDFYRHINGKWLERTEVPADKASYGAFTELADKAEADLRTIIESAAADTTRPAGSVTQQVGDLYASFMNEARAEQLGAAPAKAELAKIDAITTLEGIAAESGYLSAINAGGPINAGVEADAKDPSTTILYLGQGGTSLPDRDYYLLDDPKLAEVRAKYQAYLEKIFTLAGRPDAADAAKSVLAFETALARIQWTRVESRDALKTYNKLALADLSKEMPGFDWMAWMRPQGLDRQVNVVVAQPSFFKSLGAMAAATPLATWKAWLAAQYLTAAAPYLSKPFADAAFDFFGRTIMGQPTERERWKRGVTLVNGSIGMAVGKLYVEKTFPPAAKSRMQRMVDNLLEAYRQSITNLDWMTADTKKQALEKLGKFTTKIAYPDKWRDYTGLVIKPDDLLGNVERAQRFETDRQIAKLGKPVDRTEWEMTPQTVNAYYNPLMNEIVFPAAILQAPFFNFDADEAVNYGAIGAVIGHEIGHGFDDQGRHYDGTGALHDWWTDTDAKEFDKRAQKLVAQYNAAEPLPGLHVNGELTLGENIGDLGGVSIAYKAYKIFLAGKPSPTIDGMTGEQRLFAGWAQVWRSKYREADVRRRLLADPHSPPMFRVNIPISNIEGFYQAFDVSPRDKMYRPPADRVQIW